MTPGLQIRRKTQVDLFGDNTLPDICINIRGGISGSGEPIPKEKLQQAKGFLLLVEKTWYTAPDAYGFDEAILTLVRITQCIIADELRRLG